MSLSKLANQKILIYGFGREGKSTLKYLRKHFPDKKIFITDDQPLENIAVEYQQAIKSDKNAEFISSKGISNSPNHHFDVLFKTPGKPNKSLPADLQPIVTNQTEFFLLECRGTVIGVTGTKGKSTTASLIYEILKTASKKTVLLGNIGKPPLDYLDQNNNKDTYFVFEMSSHQLSNVKTSPNIAVILNFYPEHLDYYKSLADYAQAKANITRYQTGKDYLIYNRDNAVVKTMTQKSKAKKLSFGKDNLTEIKNLGKTSLAGEMNQMNILAALRVAKVLKIPQRISFQAIRTFRPLADRLEIVGDFKGITFINDSLATIPEATIAALDTFGNKVATIFLGGFNRHLDYSNLAKWILRSKIQTIIFFPTTGALIWGSLHKLNRGKARNFHRFDVDNMIEAVKLAYQHTPKGKICLLSCASPSFGLFKDYHDRGEQFKKFVHLYGKE